MARTEGGAVDELQRRGLALREAATVERCHTVPHHGSYSVGLHVHNMLNLLFLLHPDPPMGLVLAIQYHDVPERWTGDLPAPVRTRIRDFEKLESAIFDSLGVGYSIDVETGWWLVALDKLELLLWTKDQHAMGNCHVLNMMQYLGLWFDEHKEHIPKPVWDFLVSHAWTRTSDLLP